MWGSSCWYLFFALKMCAAGCVLHSNTSKTALIESSCEWHKSQAGLLPFPECRMLSSKPRPITGPDSRCRNCSVSELLRVLDYRPGMLFQYTTANSNKRTRCVLYTANVPRVVYTERLYTQTLWFTGVQNEGKTFMNTHTQPNTHTLTTDATQLRSQGEISTTLETNPVTKWQVHQNNQLSSLCHFIQITTLECCNHC